MTAEERPIEDIYPPRKVGGRWICDGPEGRFQARTETEAIRLLRESGGLYIGDENGETGKAKRLQDKWREAQRKGTA